MSDPFADGLVALHGSVLGMDAKYFAPNSSTGVDLRVIRSQGSETVGQTILDRDSVSILAADVAQPERGAWLQLLGTISVMGEPHVDPMFRINQDPMLDEEGFSWSCAIVLA